MWMAAGASSHSLNYTIWSNDQGAAQPAKITKLIVFGDSASDNQNLYSGTQQLVPYHGSWFMGHFSNGKVWNEYLADNLGVPNYNWAVAGAAADDYLVIPGLVSQVDSYLSYMESAPNYQPANSLFTMLIGGNDLVNYDRSVDSIIENQQAALVKLIQSGASQIVLLNLPAFDRAPVFVDDNSERDDADLIRARILEVNSRMVTMVAELKENNPLLNLRIFDAKSVVDGLLDHPRRAHCIDADEFVFWDRLHPTTHSHKIIAEGLDGEGGVAAYVRAHYPL